MAVRSLDITHFHSLAAGNLPPHHRDPFDRMLIAQASEENMVLLTADRNFQKYEVEMIFCAK
ncbi:MAG: type II toxin-antitoxin system VapC family toxin [Candidatus Acidiferrum sp.]